MRIYLFKLSMLVALGLLITTIIICCNPGDNQSEESQSNLTGNLQLDLLNKEIRKDPENASLFHDRARLYHDIENFGAAIEDMGRAVRLDSANAGYYHFLADLYLELYQSQQALQTMEMTAMLFPGRIPTLLKLSEFQLILKRHDEGFVTIGKILKIEPRNPEAYYMLGLIYQDQGNNERAIQSFQTVTEIHSGHIDAWLALGQLYSERGDELAVRCFDNAIDIDSSRLDAWHSKAFFFQNNNRPGQALAIYRKIHSLDLQYADAYLNAGILLLEMDSLDKAKNEFHMMSKVAPANPLSYYYLGVIAEDSGEYTKALHQYKQAYTLSPDFQRAREAVQRLQAAGQGEL